MVEPHDTAGVIAPPPLLFAAAIVLGLVLDWLLPIHGLGALSFMARGVPSAVLIAAGFGIAVPARLAFRAAATEVRPWRPSRVLVTGGIFAWLRNPMYVG
jgi:protein-S-isoprenylcysteine O-methyltransferase Ste14